MLNRLFHSILFHRRTRYHRCGWSGHLHQHRIDGEPDVCGAKLPGATVHNHLDSQQSGKEFLEWAVIIAFASDASDGCALFHAGDVM